jgi:NAD(P)-dependent dehydrogenase (short-subunit alcohol dehydrogenase family)
MTSLWDRALDIAVVPGFSRFGFKARGLDFDEAVDGDQRGRRVLVTGASSGIGEATTEALARAGADVHMLVRDLNRGTAAVSRIVSRAPEAMDRLHIELCDVSDLAEVRRVAEGFLARHERLDVLVNNAGALLDRRERSRDGVEMTFATNVLGPFLLTALLLPALRAAAPSRVITVSSGGMYTARLDADDPQLERRDFDGAAFYAHTKRCEVVLNRAWFERHAGDGIAFCAMHPGWADTAGLARSLPRFHRLMRPLLRDARQGADTVVWLATAPALDPASGGFWQDRAPRPEHRVPWTRETAADRERLWSYCEELTTAGRGPAAAAIPR